LRAVEADDEKLADTNWFSHLPGTETEKRKRNDDAEHEYSRKDHAQRSLSHPPYHWIWSRRTRASTVDDALTTKLQF
ncbi:MAG: hypothetical protein WBV46_04650, partial [Terriglobales bacterium]